MRIALYGTFDVENYGDLLFPLIAQRRLAGIGAQIACISPAGGSPQWGDCCASISSDEAEAEEFDGVLVGGGELIHSLPWHSGGYDRGGLTGFTAYPQLWLGSAYLAALQEIPYCWNAPGVPGPLAPDAARLATWATSVSRYVSVRDRRSAALLKEAGVTKPVRVVPDTGLDVAKLWTSDELEEAHRGAYELRGQEIGDRPPLSMHVTARYVRETDAALAGRLDRMCAAANTGAALIAIGPIHGDDATQRDIGALMTRAAVVVERPRSLREVVAVISRSRAYVGSSLHGFITACAFGLPAMLVVSEVQRAHKFAGFAAHVDRSQWIAGSWEEAEARLPDLLSVDPRTWAASRRAAAAALDAHWDAVGAVLASSPDDSATTASGRAGALAQLSEIHSSVVGAGPPYQALVPEVLLRVAREPKPSAHELSRLQQQELELTKRVGAIETELNEARQAIASRDAEVKAGHEKLEEAGRSAEAAAQEAASLRQETASARQETAFARQEAASGRQDAAAARQELDRLRSRRSVRLALKLARKAMPVYDAYFLLRRERHRGLRGAWRHVARRAKAAVTRPASLRGTPDQQEMLRAAIVAGLPAAPRTTGPLVSVLILNRSGEQHLRRCLPGLIETSYTDLEVVLVDNASTDGSLAYIEALTTPFPLEIIRNATNRSFSEANNQALAAANGELVMLLNNDVAPLEPGWLGRMVDTLLERDAVAVGPRLIYPARPGLDNTGDAQFPDLTLQHRGIHFAAEGSVPRGRNLGVGDDPRSPRATRVAEVPALTAACLLVRRAALEEVGGLDEAYTYGTEDVDLCLQLRARDGRLVYDGRAALWHYEYGTQNAEGRQRKRENRRRNRAEFVDRWGPRLFREVLLDRLGGHERWSEEPLHVAIMLTRDDPSAGWGDYYTAHELGDAFEGLGWRVSYAERYRDRWYDLDPSVDVLISLLDALDLRRVPRHVVTVAWIRNWTDRWIGHPWFDDYDVVLASSRISKEVVERRSAKVAHLLPLATNPLRFRPRPPVPDLAAEVLFVGNYWGKPRGVVDALPAVLPDLDVAVYGQGWSDLPAFAAIQHGTLDYERLPDAYSSARFVVDDTAGPTRPYGAVNSRVFDALAAGALVLSDNVAGLHELFDDDFPVWNDGDDLRRIAREFADDPERRATLVERYRQQVLERHTYARRVEQIRDLLAGWAAAPRVGIRAGIPRSEEAPSWGDHHFARALQRQLERRGHPTRVHLLPEWEEPYAARDDVALHLFGLSELRTRPGQINVLWVISHPELVHAELCERYDLVFVASSSFASQLATSVSTPVLTLLQATDPERFRPDPTGPRHELLFVANSRKVQRKIIADLTPTERDLSVYGSNWTPELLDPRYLKGELVANDELRRYYSSATIVLNDHWPDMRRAGFLSNRLYDALASGAFVISDHVEGIDDEFDSAVVTYRDAPELHALVERFLGDPTGRAEHADRGRKAVLERHTFAHRIDVLLAHIEPLLRSRPARIDEPPAA